MTLGETLGSGKFILTTDVIPPKGTDIERRLDRLAPLKGRIDAVNATELPSAVMRLGSLATSCLIKQRGMEPILQMTCRDRNLLGLQSDLISACVLGIENILALTGDKIDMSDHEGVTGVFDVDSIGLLKAARSLEQGQDVAGHKLAGVPSFCLGAAADPGAEDLDHEIERMHRKVEAGAEFFQTQPIWEINRLAEFMEKVHDVGVPVLAGILLLKSARMAEFMNKNVPGVCVPERTIDEMKSAKDPVEKSIEIGARLVRVMRDLCEGVHIMTINWEDKVAPVLDLAGL